MKIGVIPDMQIKDGIDTTFVHRVGTYLVEKRPEVWVLGGDFWDMESLSSYDVGKKVFEGRRYKKDVEAGNAAMEVLLGPLKEFNANAVKNHKERYRPRMVYLRGNHEQRIMRAINDDPKLDGTIGYQDLDTSAWEVYDFLEVVVIGGVAFSHYFVSGAMGRPITSAAALISKRHMSCFAFHQQGKQIAYGTKADGSAITAIISGSCYEHDESYMGLQGNKHWRGMFMLHDVKDGQFDEMPVSLEYLRKKYAN